MPIYKAKEIFINDSFDFNKDVGFQLFSFVEYIEFTEEIIKKEVKDKLELYEKFLKTESPDNIKNYFPNADYEVKLYTHNLYYNSIFISLYSFLERKMCQLCETGELTQQIKLNDISDLGIIKYNKYLKKVLQINMDLTNSEWAEIRKYNKLRNEIVHKPSNKIVKKQNEKLITTLKSINNLSVIDFDLHVEYEIKNKEFLLSFVKTIRVFLKNIYYEKSWLDNEQKHK